MKTKANKRNVSLLTGKTKPLAAELVPDNNPGLVEVKIRLSKIEWAVLIRHVEHHIVNRPTNKNMGEVALAAMLPKFLSDCRKKAESMTEHSRPGLITVKFAIALFVHETLEQCGESPLDDFYMELDRAIVGYDHKYLER